MGAVPKESPYEVVILVVSLVVLITGSVLVVRRDEKRLDDEQLERAWPETSRDNALIGLAFLGAPLIGLFGVWFHFFRTRSRALWPPWRWSPKGFALGLGWTALVLLANALIVTALAWALDLPIE